MRRAWSAVLALLAACSGGEPAPLRVEVAATGVRATWLQDPGLPERTLAVANIAAQQWGGVDLDGWTIRFVTDLDRCGDLASADQAILGCTEPEQRTIEVRIDGGSCVEATALLHEIGHVALPADRGHSDPRWSSGRFWRAMLGAVEGEIRKTDTACADDVAEWREWWRGRGE